MLYYVEYDTIFVNRNWVSIRWQWTVNLYTNKKKDNYIHEERQYHNNTKTQKTQNRKKKTYKTNNKCDHEFHHAALIFS